MFRKINNFVVFSESIAITKMCLFACILHGITRIFTTIIIMCDNTIRMCMFNTYNIISASCQVCSVLPLCLIFVLTSNLKCILCNRSNICCAEGQSPFFGVLLLLVIIYVVFFYASNGFEKIITFLGYDINSNTTAECVSKPWEPPDWYEKGIFDKDDNVDDKEANSKLNE